MHDVIYAFEVELKRNLVMPGLDPGIHQSSEESREVAGLPGQARQ
jgi:hypothetical protein